VCSSGQGACGNRWDSTLLAPTGLHRLVSVMFRRLTAPAVQPDTRSHSIPSILPGPWGLPAGTARTLHWGDAGSGSHDNECLGC
jgi:hypothetical protein